MFIILKVYYIILIGHGIVSFQLCQWDWWIYILFPLQEQCNYELAVNCKMSTPEYHTLSLPLHSEAPIRNLLTFQKLLVAFLAVCTKYTLGSKSREYWDLIYEKCEKYCCETGNKVEYYQIILLTIMKPYYLKRQPPVKSLDQPIHPQQTWRTSLRKVFMQHLSDKQVCLIPCESGTLSACCCRESFTARHPAIWCKVGPVSVVLQELGKTSSHNLYSPTGADYSALLVNLSLTWVPLSSAATSCQLWIFCLLPHCSSKSSWQSHKFLFKN